LVIKIVESNSSSRTSTDGKSSNERRRRSSSGRNIPEGLPILPIKKRKEILEDIEATCISMTDTIGQEEFRKMKKKKLQLIIKIGTPVTSLEDGLARQSCFYVKNIFNSVKANIDMKQVPLNPNTMENIHRNDMINIILPMMRYIDVDVIDPFIQQDVDNKIPNIELLVQQVKDTLGREHYQIGYRRTLVNIIKTQNPVGYIPMNIYINESDRGNTPEHYTDVFTNSTDITSTVIMAKLVQLNDRGLLTDMYGSPRVHINKSINYWYDTPENIVKKAVLMIDEFENILR
jgi:hypothetical protein